VPKGKAVKSIFDHPKVKKTLTKAKIGGSVVAVEKATDILDNRYINAAEAAALGFTVGGVPGALVGGSLGYLIGDQVITFPMPMIAIPAHESHLLSGSPSMQIYIRAGETLMPTGGAVDDVALGQAEAMALEAESVAPMPKKRKTPRQRAYSSAFKKIAPKYKLKNGKWKKNGFKRCVKEAHRLAGGKK